LDEDVSAYFPKGNGTEADPFQVETVEQFSAMRHNRGKHYRLMNDLDFRDYCSTQVWKPIGEYGSGEYAPERFRGVFDGNGHSIKNLTAEERIQDLSLFGVLDGAEIKRLIIEDCRITGQARLGTLAGAVYNSVLSEIGVWNSRINATLSLFGSNSGGLVGALFNSRIINAYSTGTNVYAKDRVGGISGYCNAQSLIEKCYLSSARIEGETHVGGIAGFAEGKVKNCIVTNAEINGNTTSTGRITGR
jgi:hypothetical protein